MEKQSKEIRPLSIYGAYRKQFDKIVPPFVMGFEDRGAIDYFKNQFDYILEDLDKQVKEGKIGDIESARAGFIDSVRDTCIIKIAEWEIEKQEFVNFKIRNRIALNGYITRISAVYFINDGDYIKYRKAVELANQYKLPLLILKKDN